MRTKIILSRNLNTLNHKTVKEFVILASKAIREKGFCTMVLSGGKTPRKFYESLASNRFRSQIDWKQVYFFFGDERCVSLASQLSNYRMVRETLFSKVPIPKENIFRIKGELQPAVAAEEYEKKIRKVFSALQSNCSAGSFDLAQDRLNLRCGRESNHKDFPSFDLVLLGLGADGHTASLFPKSKALKEKKCWVVSVYNEKVKPPHRVTLALPVINNAKNVWFLVSGLEKSVVLKEVQKKGKQYPAQLVKPRKGNLVWFVDQAAFPEKL